MLAAPVPGSLPLRTYRDSIRRVSVSGSQCRSALLLFTSSSDTEAGDGAYCWSSASSASSPCPSLDAWARCSPLSSSFSSGWEAAEDPDGVEELRAIALQMVHDGYMQGLIRAFGDGRSSSAHRRGLGFGLKESLLGSWFSELDVEWVLSIGKGDREQLHLEDGFASLLDMMERWIKALKTMVQVFCITQQELRAKRPTVAVGGVRKAIWHFMLLATGKMDEREQEVAQFVRFAEASILRMLDFVDAVADAALNDDQAPEMLPGMLLVYTCVVDDSPAVLALFEEASMASSMFDAMNSVFLRKMNRLSDAIWSMMEKVRASFVTDDSWRVSSAEAGGVHKTTRLMMNYIMLLSRNERALSLILQDQQRHLSHQPDYYSSSVDILIKDMISCLEKQLEKTSNFISDPGLRYIFLMNNCSFISQKVSSLLLPSWTLFEDYKIDRPKKRDPRERPPPMEDYVNQPDPNLQEQIETDSNLDGLLMIQSFIEAYLDASWEPVMSCLYHDIPRGFLKLGGRLDKFETEFDETYKKQKQWKVPNPELRKRLRKAIVEKVIPGYSKYFAERTAKGKSNRPPINTPLELGEQLEELFEG
ncbi:unnamed protein product [Miscanthus lutarioriparius]|uniref:Exocyst subunit Exo70 family protein n=1 Tax=Miscanthus lutarioriparius TaxID=422564 RepID=A0A811SEX4_9POAL|nr:unnamed protein product [Miscanthus lutarioriparius]